jgi:UDP-glucose 4-epimerase
MILVSGGAGFIGSHLVEKLVSQNEDVIVVDDFSNGYIENLSRVINKIKIIKFDISKNDLLKSLKDKSTGKIDLIFHLACFPRQKSLGNPVRDTEVNAISTLNLLELARLHDSKIVFTSNSGIYGEPEYLPIDEKHPDKPTTPYDANKLVSEYYIKIYGAIYGIENAICRLATVYGERQRTTEEWKPVIAEFVNKILNDQRPIIWGDGNQTRDFVYVSDIVDGLIQAAKSKNTNNEVFILSSGKETKIIEIVKIINRILNKSIEPIFSEPKPGDIKRMWLSYDKANRYFGFKPKVSLEEGIKRYINWARTQQEL